MVGQNLNQAASQGEGQEHAQDGAQTGYVYRDFTKYDDFFGEATPSNYHGIWAIENIIEVHSDGSADVTEIWRSRAKRSSEQTEVYVEKNFGKLGFDEDSLRVSAGVSAASYEDILDEASLRPMEYVRSWNPAGSFNDKAYKYGINRIDNSGTIEICVGISEYDTPMAYRISYKLSNFFTQYRDGVTGAYIRFINKDLKPAPRYAATYIYSDELELSGENSKIWSFGTGAYVGTINDINSLISPNGKLLASIAQEGRFSSDSHMTLLLSVDDARLHASQRSEDSFSDIKNLAFEGSSYSNNSADYNRAVRDFEVKINREWENYRRRSKIASVILIAFWVIISTFLYSIYSSFFSGNIANRKKVKYKGSPSFVVPYGADNLQIYYASTQVKLRSSSRTPKTGAAYLSSMLLRWIKDGYLLPYVPLDKKGNKNYENTSLEIQGYPEEFNNSIEHDFWEALSAVSESNEGRISPTAVDTYFTENTSRAKKIIKDTHKLAVERMIDSGLIVKKKLFKLFFTEKGIKEAEALLAFEDFVKNYSLLAEREAYEAAVWDELLIAATACEYGSLALKQMQELVPEYQFASENLGTGYELWDTYYLISSLNSLGASMSSAISSKSYSSISSSGGGGSGSIGGGSSGFSGGGSGGGFR